MLMVNHGVLNTTQHSQRGNIYRLLAECYRYPSIELCNQLEFLAKETQCLEPGLGIRGKELKNSFDALESGLAQLGIAFSKLFVGPFELIAAPYGSVYLDENRRTNLKF